MKNILDRVTEERNAKIEKSFLKEWHPFDELNKLAERKIFSHIQRKGYKFQPTHERRVYTFNPKTFKALDNTLGLAYTSSGMYAGLWCCNAGYLWANDTHHFIGFAITDKNEVYGIADDENENSIYIKL